MYRKKIAIVATRYNGMFQRYFIKMSYRGKQSGYPLFLYDMITAEVKLKLSNHAYALTNLSFMPIILGIQKTMISSFRNFVTFNLLFIVSGHHVRCILKYNLLLNSTIDHQTFMTCQP